MNRPALCRIACRCLFFIRARLSHESEDRAILSEGLHPNLADLPHSSAKRRAPGTKLFFLSFLFNGLNRYLGLFAGT
jgi:hypothetical protein